MKTNTTVQSWWVLQSGLAYPISMKFLTCALLFSGVWTCSLCIMNWGCKCYYWTGESEHKCEQERRPPAHVRFVTVNFISMSKFSALFKFYKII